jgi:hypothetical protein
MELRQRGLARQELPGPELLVLELSGLVLWELQELEIYRHLHLRLW